MMSDVNQTRAHDMTANSAQQAKFHSLVRIQHESSEERVERHLGPSDWIYVQMESLNMWLHVTLHLSNLGENSAFKLDFDVQIKQDYDGKQLKKLVQKYAIQFWNRLNLDKNKVDEEEEEEEEDENELSIGRKKADKRNEDEIYLLTALDIFRNCTVSLEPFNQRRGSRNSKSQYDSKASAFGADLKTQGTSVGRQGENVRTELTPLEDDHTVAEMFDYQQNRIYAKASFQTVVKFYADFRDALGAQVEKLEHHPMIVDAHEASRAVQYEDVESGHNFIQRSLMLNLAEVDIKHLSKLLSGAHDFHMEYSAFLRQAVSSAPGQVKFEYKSIKRKEAPMPLYRKSSSLHESGAGLQNRLTRNKSHSMMSRKFGGLIHHAEPE